MEKQANAKSLPLHVKLGEGLAVKPGCGGAWQAGDRSDATFDEMIGMDLMYVKHCSVKYDLQLIFGTLRAMIVGGCLLEASFISCPGW